MLVDTRSVDSAVPPASVTRVRVAASDIRVSVRLSFFLLIAFSLIFGWHPLIATLTLALQSDQYTHILLIIPITASLTYLDWQTLSIGAQRDLPLGSALLGSAALIASLLWLRPSSFITDLQLFIAMLALVTWGVGAFVLCFGIRVARACLFPLCFLFGLVPMPQAVLDVIIDLLQQGSSLAAYLLFTIAGVPAVRNGVMLTIPSLTIEVAKECSSIRSSLMLVITTMVLAHLLVQSPWRKAVLVAAAVPLSVAKNGLRIFTIAMLGTRVDPGYLNGKFHRQGGMIFFAISLLAVGSLLMLIHRIEPRSRSTKRSRQLQTTQSSEN